MRPANITHLLIVEETKAVEDRLTLEEPADDDCGVDDFSAEPFVFGCRFVFRFTEARLLLMMNRVRWGEGRRRAGVYLGLLLNCTRRNHSLTTYTS